MDAFVATLYWYSISLEIILLPTLLIFYTNDAHKVVIIIISYLNVIISVLQISLNVLDQAKQIIYFVATLWMKNVFPLKNAIHFSLSHTLRHTYIYVRNKVILYFSIT